MTPSVSANQKDRIDKPGEKMPEREAPVVKELVQMILYLLSNPKGYGLSAFYIHDLDRDHAVEIAEQLDVVERQFGTVTRPMETKESKLDVGCTVGFDDDEYWSKNPTVHTEYLEVIYEKIGRGYLVIEIANIDSLFEIKTLKFGILPEYGGQIRDKVKTCAELVKKVHDKHETARHQANLESQKLRASRSYECRYVSRQGVKLIDLMNSGVETRAAKIMRYKTVAEEIDSYGAKESWETDKIESQKRVARCFLDITANIVFTNQWGENDAVNYSEIKKICQFEKLDYVAKCVKLSLDK
jgi:hypothetical protein